MRGSPAQPMSGVVNGRFLVVVAFVIERDHHVLLLRRSMSKDHAPGEWEPGSGRVRQGEAPLAALLRERRPDWMSRCSGHLTRSTSTVEPRGKRRSESHSTVEPQVAI